MNTSHPDDSQQTPAEREFDEFLRDEDSRIAALYRKLPAAEPDAALDARVRAQAQRALREDAAAARAPARQRRIAPRWLPAFGVAATLVLAAGIVWRAEPQLWTTRNDAAAPPPPTAGSGMAPTRSDATSAQPAEAASAPDQAAPPRSAPHTATLATAAPPAAAPAQSVPALEKKSAPMPAPPAAADTAKRKAIAAMPQPPAFADAPPPKPAAPSAQKAETAISTSAAAQAGAAVDAMQDRASEPMRFRTKPVAPPAAVTLAAPTAAPASEPEPDRAPPPPAPPPAPLAESAPMPAPMSAPAPPATSEPTLTAPPPAAETQQEHWIARIRVLLTRHQRDEAIWNLAQFRKQYPDYPLPPDLRELQ